MTATRRDVSSLITIFRRGVLPVKKLSFIFVLLALLTAISVVSITQAVAQKESHKDYGAMKISDCNDCHRAQGIAPNHDAAWLRSHRLPAARGESNCNECHEQAFCLDCHTGGGIDAKLSTRNYQRDYMPRSHRNDFLEFHPLQAKISPQSCNRCHDQKYCTSCHAKFQSADLQFQSHRRQFRDIPLSSVGPNARQFYAGPVPDLPSQRSAAQPQSGRAIMPSRRGVICAPARPATPTAMSA